MEPETIPKKGRPRQIDTDKKRYWRELTANCLVTKAEGSWIRRDEKQPEPTHSEYFTGGEYGFQYPRFMGIGKEAVETCNEIEVYPGAIKTVEEFLRVNPKP